MTRLLLTFAFDARTRWDRSPEWRAAERARAESGSTSLRVSKAASKALADLGERIRAAIPEKEKSRYHRDRGYTPDELIAALAAGVVVFPAPEPATPAPARAHMHAKPDPRGGACNGIPVHAKPAAAAAACKSPAIAARKKVHAKHDRTTHAKPAGGKKRARRPVKRTKK